jgi:hypothetical protein
MTKNVTVQIPSWVSTPTDLASTLMDGPAFVSLGRQLDDMLVEHKEMLDDMVRIREALIAFGALAEDDRNTGVADLIEVLLPAVEP